MSFIFLCLQLIIFSFLFPFSFLFFLSFFSIPKFVFPFPTTITVIVIFLYLGSNFSWHQLNLSSSNFFPFYLFIYLLHLIIFVISIIDYWSIDVIYACQFEYLLSFLTSYMVWFELLFGMCYYDTLLMSWVFLRA